MEVDVLNLPDHLTLQAIIVARFPVDAYFSIYCVCVFIVSVFKIKAQTSHQCARRDSGITFSGYADD